jgi:nucleoside-diphosphate-sugar epimerase
MPHVKVHFTDLADPVGVAAVVRAVRPDMVFHLAAYGAYSWETDLHRLLQANVIGTANLLASCLEKGFEVFVNAGSSSEYGLKDHAPSERDWIDPNSYYAASKAGATFLCRQAARESGRRIVTLRLYSVFGPYEEPKRLLPTIILHGLDGRLPPLVNPDTARDFVYVDDVLDAFMLAATTESQEPGAVYNVGTGIQTTIRDVVVTARSALGIAEEPQWGSMANRKWDTTSWVSNNELIRSALGWKSSRDFRSGFVEMTEWFKAHPDMLKYYRKMIL